MTITFGFLWCFTNPATSKNLMPLPRNAEIRNRTKFNLNNPAVIVTSLNGKGVNAPSNTISIPCFENKSVIL